MYSGGGHELATVLLVFIIIVVIALLFGICAVVGSMADKRGRSVFGWILFSLFAAPFSVILLLCLGETEEKRKNRIEEESYIFWKVKDEYFGPKTEDSESNKSEKRGANLQDNPIGMSVNDMYKTKLAEKHQKSLSDA